ncbi:MAG: poly(3-hydroxybutyrate) depolymerase [Propionivibrio sp.]|uniref:Poly(3-hydroxybutyrate) depolymerase n=1 Tax=Candidatus Propionivibrio dominans TaxID=2954373 RepID=A0A9D7F8J4_9RHOO|nr:poly(3-hydroxybutyrate) depolymerase [Candidatus Propionivibrio dominans]
MSFHSCLSLGALLLCAVTASAQPLPKLTASTRDVTVSGISSGAYMAVQFQIAYSGIVRGAGAVAGGPYYCAEGSLRRALGNCMAPSGKDLPPTADETLKTIRQLAEAGRIDPPGNLGDDRVWLLTGGNDKIILTPVMDALDAFYHATLPADAISYVKVPEAGHAMLSIADPQANACPTSATPFINRCQDFDAPGRLLNHLIGPLQPPETPLTPATGETITFDQSPFVAGRAIDAGLAEQGYAFVPAACRSGVCRIHVAFHGCLQNAGEIGRRFVDGAGYNGWAASNRIVVLYPQTVRRYGFALGSWRWMLNPKGCWDWWGYTGADYHTRDGAQMRAVRAMIETLGMPSQAVQPAPPPVSGSISY